MLCLNASQILNRGLQNNECKSTCHTFQGQEGVALAPARPVVILPNDLEAQESDQATLQSPSTPPLPISFCSNGQEWKQKKWNASSFQSPNPIRWPFCFYIPRSILGTVNQRIVWFSQTAVFNSLEEKGSRSFLLAQSGGWEIILYVLDFSIRGGNYYYTMNVNNYNSLKLVAHISKDFLPYMNFRRNRKHRQY